MRQALVVPESAVQFDDTTAYIFVIGDRPAGQGGFGAGGQGGVNGQATGPAKIATKRAVVVGGRDRGVIEVKQGVRAGEIIVADGINRLQAVTPVRVVRAGEAGGDTPAGPRGGQAGGRAAGQGGEGGGFAPRQGGAGGPGAVPGGQRPQGAGGWNGQRRPGGGQAPSTGA